MKRVVIESPYAAFGNRRVEDNVAYARACMLDSLERGEAPFGSHLLYTQALNDANAAERKRGMDAGLEWASTPGVMRAFYCDFGMTHGMIAALEHTREIAQPFEIRYLYREKK